ncbi:NADH-quinone oxidoreductase subunit J [Caminibacter mediatlanticus TB-2]|uniref:NADH-quinone oxidoreductase subunit J n=1 Tax=Caminibacter mediatlanticus TB-2 TaxID=391592 RepID=A0AAI9AGJ5_9BACT|nr:NADH-quinone oxidoreductase subunit J [Caminibacter mediatlanticus]EDM23233.1 NADH-ubiquinone/plastoquinone oxidoreductase, chain 6 [Caminibacter mediatlanticus TB-2]QCT94160.1 NADH-quinone oxidoreductase subunit J [Caminibacter mediatlanticus TB-2]
MSVLILVIAIILAVMSLTQKNTVGAVIAFVMMMFLLGIYYIFLGEKLLGLFQIFVYTGGIVVLTLFGVTVIGAKFPEFKIRPWAISIVTVILIGLMIIPFLLPEIPYVGKMIPLKEQVKIFTDFYGEIAIFMSVVAASILYGSIRMLHTLKHGKE